MSRNPEIPAIRVNSESIVNIVSPGTGVKDNTISKGHWHADTHPWQTAVLPRIHDASLANIAKESDTPICDAVHDRLRDHSVLHPSSKSELGFWPRKLFDRLIGKKDVESLLQELAQTDRKTDDGSPINDAAETISTRYRRILALLLLIDKGELIREFVFRGIDDSRLPFPMNYNFNHLIKRADRDTIRKDYQWRLNVPFFQPLAAELGNLRGLVCHMDISEFDIQPWDRLDMKPREAPQGNPDCLSVRTAEHTAVPASLTLAGGFGEVHKIIIHPWQHGFHDVLDNVSFPPANAGPYSRSPDLASLTSTDVGNALFM